MVGTFWSLVPAIVAIALALITQEVYSSLFIGVVIGAAFFAGSNGSGFSGFLTQTFQDGLVKSIADPYNIGILVFLVILGVIVALMNKAGGSAAFGNWAKKHIKSKVGAQVATICLGILIFIDDYFNCLTVGSVMRPVTDKYKVSRQKLAYLIDATAAPVCIIAPISSWAAAVSGFVTEGENGLALFCKAIPYNYYALFTIVFMFVLAFTKTDFGSMAKMEAMVGEVTEDEEEGEAKKGTVFDLVFPIAVLIVTCTLGMVYSGGFFTKDGDTYLNFIMSFASSDASVGLVIGSFASLIITVAVYMIRRVLPFKECMTCIPEGFKAMVPAILILCLAWTLKTMTDSLGAKDFVSGVVSGSAAGFKNMLPAIIFIIACGLAFATGTSWGTFGILIPICIAVFTDTTDPLRIISISACMAGAVCGDHVSPISDTTIMASAGAQCNHVEHVYTQLPYAMVVAAISFVCYIVAGIVKDPVAPLLTGLVIMAGFIVVVKIVQKKKSGQGQVVA